MSSEFGETNAKAIYMHDDIGNYVYLFGMPFQSALKG